jgi:hypothetical protein
MISTRVAIEASPHWRSTFMFHEGLAKIIQAEREREIAELVRQRRLLKREPECDPDGTATASRIVDPRTARVGARAAGG